jgi:hypothetical protein
MAVLLGGIGATKKSKYEPLNNIYQDHLYINQYINEKDSSKNKFYVEYAHYRPENPLMTFRYFKSPIFEGTYKNNSFIKPITEWITNLGGDPKAQFKLRISNYYELARFKRLHKAK